MKILSNYDCIMCMTCYLLPALYHFSVDVLLCCMLCWTRECDVWGWQLWCGSSKYQISSRKCLSSYSHVEIRCLVAPWLLSLGLSSVTGMEVGGGGVSLLLCGLWSLVSKYLLLTMLFSGTPGTETPGTSGCPPSVSGTLAY